MPYFGGDLLDDHNTKVANVHLQYCAGHELRTKLNEHTIYAASETRKVIDERFVQGWADSVVQAHWTAEEVNNEQEEAMKGLFCAHKSLKTVHETLVNQFQDLAASTVALRSRSNATHQAVRKQAHGVRGKDKATTAHRAAIRAQGDQNRTVDQRHRQSRADESERRSQR